jgi:hypothetical protein
MDWLKIARDIQASYMASVARGSTEAYREGAQIGRLGLSLELCQHAEGTPECMDWRRGYFTELGKGKR